MAAQELDLLKTADAFTRAFSDADWDRLRALITTDVHYHETGTQRTIDGADAYLALVQGWKQAFPDARGTIQRIVASGDTVVQEVLWEGTQTGPFVTATGTLPPSGTAITMEGSLWLMFQGDRSGEIHSHLNALHLLQQLGVLPAARE
jgi:steroid delta-isomerase-like uncharacterized protein